MTDNEWEDSIAKHLVGRIITYVEYLPRDEADENYWDSRPIAIKLDNGHWLMPMRDDEGNDGGAISTTFEDLPVIPVWRD